MPVVMTMHWPEITLDQYEEVRRKVNWEGDHPTGGMGHIAWFKDDGLHVVDVWESAEAFDRFGQERLMPVIVGELGITSQPDVHIAPAHSLFRPEAGGF